MNTTEGNKLIAEFMGLKKCTRCEDCGAYMIGSLPWNPEEMQYHKSWDWLMLPVRKIQELKFDVVIEIGNGCHVCGERGMIDFHTFTSDETGGDIASLYSVILEFIKWYNESMEDHCADQQFMPPDIDLI